MYLYVCVMDMGTQVLNTKSCFPALICIPHFLIRAHIEGTDSRVLRNQKRSIHLHSLLPPVQGQGTPQGQEADGPPGAEGGAAGAEGGVAGPTPVPGGVLGHLGDEEAEPARSWC